MEACGTTPELHDLANHIAANPVINSGPLSLEVRKATRKLQNGCAAGPDGVPPKLLKGAWESESTGLHQLLNVGIRQSTSKMERRLQCPCTRVKDLALSMATTGPVSFPLVPGKVFAHVLLVW